MIKEKKLILCHELVSHVLLPVHESAAGIARGQHWISWLHLIILIKPVLSTGRTWIIHFMLAKITNYKHQCRSK
jgi:hypothetical protein